jgi:hypothetical protein
MARPTAHTVQANHHSIPLARRRTQPSTWRIGAYATRTQPGSATPSQPIHFNCTSRFDALRTHLKAEFSCRQVHPIGDGMHERIEQPCHRVRFGRKRRREASSGEGHVIRACGLALNGRDFRRSARLLLQHPLRQVSAYRPL